MQQKAVSYIPFHAVTAFQDPNLSDFLCEHTPPPVLSPFPYPSLQLRLTHLNRIGKAKKKRETKKERRGQNPGSKEGGWGGGGRRGGASLRTACARASRACFSKIQLIKNANQTSSQRVPVHGLSSLHTGLLFFFFFKFQAMGSYKP